MRTMRPVHTRLLPFPAALLVLAALLTALGPATGAVPLTQEQNKDPKKKEKQFALIFVTVFTAEGFALPGVRVTLKRKDDRKPKWKATSDARGEFALRVPAASGVYEVSTASKQHQNQTKTVEIAGQESVTVIFRLKHLPKENKK